MMSFMQELWHNKESIDSDFDSLFLERLITNTCFVYLFFGISRLRICLHFSSYKINNDILCAMYNQ